MKKFIVIYNSNETAKAQTAQMTPEQQAKGMAGWMAWNEKHSDHIVELGAPLMPGQSLNAAGEWAGSTTEVSGYSIVQGESAESVRAIFDGHPHLSWAEGCTIDVHECIAM